MSAESAWERLVSARGRLKGVRSAIELGHMEALRQAAELVKAARADWEDERADEDDVTASWPVADEIDASVRTSAGG